MKKKLKRIAITLMAFAMGLLLTACSGMSNNGLSQGSEETSQNEVITAESLSIDDIDWSVKEGIDNNRHVFLDYTNNSSYPILYLKLNFMERSDLTEEEKDAYYAEMEEIYDLDAEKMENLKSWPISMEAEERKLVAPSESARNIEMWYSNFTAYMDTYSHYGLMEPDSAEIEFLSDGKLYTINYDFKSDTYVLKNEIEEAYEWSTKDIGNQIQKPNAEVLQISADTEERFAFTAYGFSLDQFNEYVETCKTQGYTLNTNEYNGYYSADNEAGCNIAISYNEENNSMNGAIEM